MLKQLGVKRARAARLCVAGMQVLAWSVLSGCQSLPDDETLPRTELPEVAPPSDRDPASPSELPPPEEESPGGPRLPLAPRRFYAGVAPEGLALGDFNGDGKTDVAVASVGRGFSSEYVTAPGAVVVLLNDGKGGLTRPSFVAPRTRPERLAVADLDGDGRQDLVVGSFWGTGLLPGRGDGTFATEQSRSVSSGYASSLEVGSFLGDSRLDLWVSSSYEDRGDFASFVLVENTATGLKSEPVRFEDGTPLLNGLDSGALTASADFDGDGRRDFAMVREGVTLFLRTGDRTVRRSDAVEERAHALATGDFDRDGHADLLLVSESWLVLYQGDGHGHLQRSWKGKLAGPGGALLVQDLDADGWLDAAVTHRQEGSVSVLFGQQQGFFREGTVLAVGRAPSAVAAADLDGDGASELLVAESDANAILVRQLPRPPVAEPVSPSTCFLRRRDTGRCDALRPVATVQAGLASELGPYASHVVTADFDGDGRKDLAFPLKDKGLRMLLNQGDGAFKAQETLLDAYVTQLVPGDFNRDGRVDLAVAHEWLSSDPQGWQPMGAAIYWNDGAGQFSHAREMLTLSYMGPYLELAAADFNADGWMDLGVVIEGQYVPRALLFTNQGAGTFQSEELPDHCREPDDNGVGLRKPVVADFDGDGLLDLGHLTLGFNLNYIQASGTVRPGQGFSLGGRLLSVAELDGDGHPDLVRANGDGSVGILRGDLGGTLQHSERCVLSSTQANLEAMDLDGDGWSDFLGLGHTEPVVMAILGAGGGEFDSQELSYTFGALPLWARPVDLLGDARPELAVLLRDGSLVILETGCP